jgi:hypothetical protein
VDAAIETNAKYNYLRKEQAEAFGKKVPLMPNERQPALPPLEQLVPSDLLNPALQKAPPGTTPAERAQGSEGSVVAPTVTAPVVPPPPTTPFGTPPSTPPPADPNAAEGALP